MTKILSWMHANRWIGWIGAVPFLVTAAVWALDRSPPFEILSVPNTTVYIGGHSTLAVVRFQVRRDVARGCSARMTRYVVTSRGFRLDLHGSIDASAEDIAAIEAATPGEAYVAVDLPASIPEGPTLLVANIAYRCNFFHTVWPINVRTEVPFYVTREELTHERCRLLHETPLECGTPRRGGPATREEPPSLQAPSLERGTGHEGDRLRPGKWML